MQSASAPLLTESAFPIRCLTGAVVKTEREETTTALSHLSRAALLSPGSKLWHRKSLGSSQAAS